MRLEEDLQQAQQAFNSIVDLLVCNLSNAIDHVSFQFYSRSSTHLYTEPEHRARDTFNSIVDLLKQIQIVLAQTRNG